MKSMIANVVLALAALALPAAAQAGTSLEGRWINAKGSVVVRVTPCGNALCGSVVNANARAKAGARKGGHPNLIGTQILTGLKPTGNGTYKGRAFDPKRNLHVPATVRVLGSSTLSVKGCVISGLICKEQRWTRVN